ncbi:MAG: HypC/HybG/HupF family hydrogenase formation chaperone [Campylobacterota bacterium]|nr:HypC/HybG/HupF family hydrogenase formation chaperone [Campylobacterota bacterium]
MCLSIPSKIVEIDEDNVATVDTMGVKRQVSLDLMGDDATIGDYVLIHVGFAMSKIDEADALESLKVYGEIIEKMEEHQGELSAAQERDHLGGERRQLIEDGDNCANRDAP